MRTINTLAALALSTGLLTMPAAADAQTRVHARGSHGTAVAASGPDGGVVRGRGAVRNADGSVTAASGGAFRTATGARSARGSTTTVNPDGSATRRGGFAASGVRGSAASQGTVIRNADGTYSGGRSTTATSTTGATYNGSVQIDAATGKPVRSATCTNASGAIVACPR